MKEERGLDYGSNEDLYNSYANEENYTPPEIETNYNLYNFINRDRDLIASPTSEAYLQKQAVKDELRALRKDYRDKYGSHFMNGVKDFVKGVRDIDTDKMPTLGDLISMYGAYKAGHDPYELTMQQRAGDTPNINPYENYGQRGLNKMEETKLNLQNNLDQAIQNNQLNSNAMRANANANARSINTARAMGLAIDAQQRQADNQAYSQYSNQIANINGKIAGMLDQQDKMVMTGNQLRDDNDRRDRDNFYTQLQKDIETRNKSTQYMGAYLNNIKERNYKQNLVDESSEIFSIDSNGKLKAKRNVEYTPEQKGFLGSYKGAFEDWNKKVAEEGYEFIDGKYYNNKGEEVDIKKKGFPVIKEGSKVETAAMKGNKILVNTYRKYYSDQLPEGMSDEDILKFMKHIEKGSETEYKPFKLSDGREINFGDFDEQKYRGKNWANYNKIKDGKSYGRPTSMADLIKWQDAGFDVEEIPEFKPDDYLQELKTGSYNGEVNVNVEVNGKKTTEKIPFKYNDLNNVFKSSPKSLGLGTSNKSFVEDFHEKYPDSKMILDNKETLEYFRDLFKDDNIKTKADLVQLLKVMKLL